MRQKKKSAERPTGNAERQPITTRYGRQVKILLEGRCCNINLWVPLCGVPDLFVGRLTSRGHAMLSDILFTVFNVALSLFEGYLSFNRSPWLWDV